MKKSLILAACGLMTLSTAFAGSFTCSVDKIERASGEIVNVYTKTATTLDRACLDAKAACFLDGDNIEDMIGFSCQGPELEENNSVVDDSGYNDYYGDENEEEEGGALDVIGGILDIIGTVTGDDDDHRHGHGHKKHYGKKHGNHSGTISCEYVRETIFGNDIQGYTRTANTMRKACRKAERACQRDVGTIDMCTKR